jgi:hypothetical protein
MQTGTLLTNVNVIGSFLDLFYYLKSKKNLQHPGTETESMRPL